MEIKGLVSPASEAPVLHKIERIGLIGSDNYAKLARPAMADARY